MPLGFSQLCVSNNKVVAGAHQDCVHPYVKAQQLVKLVAYEFKLRLALVQVCWWVVWSKEVLTRVVNSAIQQHAVEVLVCLGGLIFYEELDLPHILDRSSVAVGFARVHVY